MEAELTELSEKNPKPENLAVTEEADVYEAIPMHLLKERKTKAYKDIMNIDIEKIDNFSKRNKLYTTQWRTIHEVIVEAYFKESDIFLDGTIYV